MPWLQPNNYTESLYLFPACVLHYNVERTKPGRPVFSPPALRLLNARVEKTGWTLHEFEKRKKGWGTIFKLGRRKNSFQKFRRRTRYFLPAGQTAVSRCSTPRARGGGEEKAGRLEKRGRSGRATRNSTVLPAVSWKHPRWKLRNCVSVWLPSCGMKRNWSLRCFVFRCFHARQHDRWPRCSWDPPKYRVRKS